MIDIYFHFGDGLCHERQWPAVPRLGETVILDEGEFIVSEVHWEANDPLDIPFVHLHLEPRPK